MERCRHSKSVAPPIATPLPAKMEYNFVKNPPEEYSCLICAKLLDQPHLTDCCGQHFCQACLKQWFKKQGKKICPHCRSEIFSHMRSLPLKRKIDDLEVYCPNKAEGCELIIRIGWLKNHTENECGFARILCTQGCGKLSLRKDLRQHCSNECMKRKTKCKYCGEEDHFEVIMGIHTTVCEDYPVNCPQGCHINEHGGLKRRDLLQHAKICPLEVVQCPFHDAGCDVIVLRKYLDSHMESSTQQHLLKMMITYNRLKEDVKELSSQMTNLILFEPGSLTKAFQSISFSILVSDGWIGPPFYVLDGYKFCIKHQPKEQDPWTQTASLLLLKGKFDDSLEWPINLDYDLQIFLQNPMTHIKTVCLSASRIKRVLPADGGSVEMVKIRIPKVGKPLNNCGVSVELHPCKHYHSD